MRMSLSAAIQSLIPSSLPTHHNHNHPAAAAAAAAAGIGNRRTLKYDILKPKATGHKETNPKTKSVVCTDCDGNGTVQCSQCKGSGVNPVDFFNGQFKAGDSCWLCGGRKEMLCGNCNGAGFVGGFLSGFDN